jgi:hypothetical protein
MGRLRSSSLLLKTGKYIISARAGFRRRGPKPRILARSFIHFLLPFAYPSFPRQDAADSWVEGDFFYRQPGNGLMNRKQNEAISKTIYVPL